MDSSALKRLNSMFSAEYPSFAAGAAAGDKVNEIATRFSEKQSLLYSILGFVIPFPLASGIFHKIGEVNTKGWNSLSNGIVNIVFMVLGFILLGAGAALLDAASEKDEDTKNESNKTAGIALLVFSVISFLIVAFSYIFNTVICFIGLLNTIDESNQISLACVQSNTSDTL